MRAMAMADSTLQWRVAHVLGNLATRGGVLALLVAALTLSGCSRSFFDPSKTGAFRDTPTTMPVLTRIDVIEPPDSAWARATPPSNADLLPSTLEYRLIPGDVLTVSVLELRQTGLETVATGRIDASGMFRMPVLGDIPAAGMTVQEFQDQVVDIVNRDIVVDPQVNVVLEEGGGFSYTVYGTIEGTGLYTLRRGDFRLMEALAVAGGIAEAIQTVYVIRQVNLAEQMDPQYDLPTDRQTPQERPVDVDELIEQLDDPAGGGASPGAFPAEDAIIDIDDLEPIRRNGQAVVDVDTLSPQEEVIEDAEGDSFIYIPERNEWVRVRGGEEAERSAADEAESAEPGPMAVERVIEIPAPQLLQGDSSVNIVIRPYDRIYVKGPAVGVVYIEGEVNRPGVYQLPVYDDLTLSRLLSAAGGLGPLAIPERVDLTREVGRNLEATIRMNLGAIRNRTQPDVVLKPNDHVIIGTAWFATPLAIFRNGFRMTYGFGFLLDRNFGNDVFGAPPDSNNNN